jgi:hypothetical protein
MFVEQRLQKVHSNEQIIASTESAGNGIAQCSQAFLISNILSSYSVMRVHHDRLEISLFDETFDIFRSARLRSGRWGLPPAETCVAGSSAARVPASKYDQ